MQGKYLDPGGNQGIRTWVVKSSLPLLLIGLSIPLAEFQIPERFTDRTLAHELSLLEFGDEDVFSLAETYNSSSTDLEIFSGKALYPRYFEAGTSLEDHPKGRYSDFTIDRTEFFLVGTENTWAALPGKETNGSLSSWEFGDNNRKKNTTGEIMKMTLNRIHPSKRENIFRCSESTFWSNDKRMAW